MDLSWKKRVLGNVCSARIIVERKQKQPDSSDDNTQNGHEWQDPREEERWVFAQFLKLCGYYRRVKSLVSRFEQI
jgi:hypothetical protein